MIDFFTQSCKEAKTAKSSVYIRNVWRRQGRTRGRSYLLSVVGLFNR